MLVYSLLKCPLEGVFIKSCSHFRKVFSMDSSRDRVHFLFLNFPIKKNCKTSGLSVNKFVCKHKFLPEIKMDSEFILHDRQHELGVLPDHGITKETLNINLKPKYGFLRIRN